MAAFWPSPPYRLQKGSVYDSPSIQDGCPIGKIGTSQFAGEMIVKEMIENTRVWLIDQMGRNFPLAKGNFLLKRWKKLEPLFQSLV